MKLPIIRNKTAALRLMGIVMLFAISAGVYIYFSYGIPARIGDYMNHVFRIERLYIESIPIYEDFSSAEKEARLRTYLQNEHIRVARDRGVTPVKNEADIKTLEAGGRLVKIDPGQDKMYFFYNVREASRYLTPSAAEGLQAIVTRFQENIQKRKSLPPVKIALSSMLRSAEYQSDLKYRNENATVVSTHSYGTSFDIFYDEYFVVLPEPEEGGMMIGRIHERGKYRMGFLLGASLRRQFRAVLMETLLQLQDEGVLYAIQENRQRCYHITIIR